MFSFACAAIPTAVCEKCYFLPAEARKRQKMFFSHTAGRLGLGGFQAVRVTFLFASGQPDLCSRPPTRYQ